MIAGSCSAPQAHGGIGHDCTQNIRARHDTDNTLTFIDDGNGAQAPFQHGGSDAPNICNWCGRHDRRGHDIAHTPFQTFENTIAVNIDNRQQISLVDHADQALLIVKDRRLVDSLTL